MRFEVQPWNRVTARMEIVLAGVPQTGRAPTSQIKRLADSQYWNGATWQVGATDVAMTEIDSVNEPGVYELPVLLAQLDYTLGLQGYRFWVEDASEPLYENCFVKQETMPWMELVTSYVTTGTFGHRVAMALGIAGQFWARIMGQAGPNPVYDGSGRLLTARHAVYPSSADVTADTNRIGQIDVTATYDVDGNLATFKAE